MSEVESGPRWQLANLLIAQLASPSSHRGFVEKPWGREFIVSADDVILKVIWVNAGHRTSKQMHMVKSEALTLIAGDGTIEGTSDDDLGRPRPSPTYRIDPMTTHRAVGPLLILEVTTPQNEDVVRLEDDYQRTDR